MAWIDYWETYDMVSHSWTLACARMVGMAQNIITLTENSMENWNTVLTSNQVVLGTVNGSDEKLGYPNGVCCGVLQKTA